MALEAALRDDGHLSHAYLFHGPAGTGKRTAARAFAAALLAEGQHEPEDVRRRVLSGVHPDLTWIEPRGAHEILVDDVRTRVVREAALRPFEASRRVFVIADADRMNDESQNALLKTLEEPSPFAHFVLVSSAPGRLLPTIPSRCRQVRFGPVPAAERGRAAGGRGRRVAAGGQRRAPGRRGRAACAPLAGEGAEQRADAEPRPERWFSSPVRTMPPGRWRQPWQPLLDRAAKAGASAERQLKKELERDLEDQPRKGRQGFAKEQELQARRARRRAHTASLDQSLALVGLWFRDLAAVAAGAAPQVFNADRLDELEQDAGGREVGRFVRCLELFEQARLRLERNVLEDLALESLFNRMRRVVATGAA